MSTIGIDPATLTGWAYRDRADKWHFGRCQIDLDDYRMHDRFDGSPPDILTILLDAAAAGVTHAAIEDTYLGVNPHTFQVLSEIVGVIIVSCGTAGIKHTMVPAMIWKHAILTVGGYFPKERHEQKAMALWVAKNALHADVKYEDEADAVCLSSYFEAQLRLADLAKS